ncbi:MAG TPA: hypothetical protein PKG48_09925, partial [Bacteroidales bacterium]|nr:hypothetical protein [Bacteroidales bacterium]
GSSGALCAALWDRYGIHKPAGRMEPDDLTGMIRILSALESPIHGKSSGFDPLVAWLGQPVRLIPGGIPEPVPAGSGGMASRGSAILLVDTGRPGSTGPLVGNFLQQFFPGGSVTSEGEQFRRLADQAISRFLSVEGSRFSEVLSQLSGFQLEKLSPMIPKNFLPLWREGLRTGLFTFKLCGSGGGGYLLCFTGDPAATQDFFREAPGGPYGCLPVTPFTR